MKLIIGGAYQGKLDFALTLSGDKSVHQCCIESTDIDISKSIINSFHLFVLAQMRSGIDTLKYIEDNANLFADKIIISDDISCGVVPSDKEMRLLRERVGRSLSKLSLLSDDVYRVFCGIGTKIK